MIQLPHIWITDNECSVIAEQVKEALNGQCQIVTVVMVDMVTGRPIPFYLDEEVQEWIQYDYHTVCLTGDGYGTIIIDYGNRRKQFDLVSYMNHLKIFNKKYIPATTRIIMFEGHYDDRYLVNPAEYLRHCRCITEL